ncbi:MAG: WD40 repeat domain-containing protein [Gammaproteobacteria bacterium]|nr:WD40 repeat domain-containing protein [Gammaproteobacteria bacterium]
MSNNNFEANPFVLPQKRTFGELNQQNRTPYERNNATIEPISPNEFVDENLDQTIFKTPVLRKSPESRDRFIPNRNTSLYEDGLFANHTATTAHSQFLIDSLMGSSPRRIFSYEDTSPQRKKHSDTKTHLTFTERLIGVPPSNFIRYQPVPTYKFRKYKVLDACGLHSDFYYHLLSWSKANRLFTAIKNDMNEFLIYSCNSERSGYSSIYQSAPITYGMNACSVKAMGFADVVTGWNTGHVMIHTVDEARIKPKKNIILMDKSLNCLEVVGENQLWIGSKEGWLNGYDIRQAKVTIRFESNKDVSLPHDVLAGITFNHEYLVAVGTNLGAIKVWDIRRTGGTPYFSDALHNQSGVKALAFNPNNPKELVSGGGSSCQNLILRNIEKPDDIPKKINLGCQITGVAWLEKKDHFIATTGFTAQLGLFRKNSMELEALTNISLLSDEAPGRMVYLAARQNQCVATYDGNETLNYFSIDGIDNMPRTLQTGHINTPGFLQSSGPYTIR